MKTSVLLGVGFALFVFTRTGQNNTVPDDSIFSPIIDGVLGMWHAPTEYANLISQVEINNNIPTGILERLLYQECHYRDDIISGATRSPVGALGIAQFMPATAKDLGINPLEPNQAIPAAGIYLSKLFARFGNWSEALAAYNWGMGNVSRKGLDKAPPETVAYYTNILGDVNAEYGTLIA